ncbi:DUF6527 family protein [Pseudomonas sp. CR3202]|uniref:DUF6527 family protein n=1 Tax=Pseudomonas sp. CR3202 TaxID=3351532 RepID=UPI003BF34BA3
MKALIARWYALRRFFEDWLAPRLRAVRIEGDALPKRFPRHQLIHLVDDGESWSAGFHCPCGCGDILEVALLKGASPRWELSVDRKGRPTLHPSVWRATGCGSHFWVRDGRIHWCKG